MSRVLIAVLCCAPLFAWAQSDGGTASAQSAQTSGKKDDLDDVRREVDAKVESAKKEMREEIRAQLATQSVAQGWQEEWVEQNRKLDLFEISGYFRIRPELFNKMDLHRDPDPNGYTLWPLSPASPRDRTASGTNMRLRLEPTLNVSEEVRIKMQIDVFDNLIFGSTPDYGFVRQQRDQFGIFSMSQASPQAGINAVTSSIAVKRAWGEVSTPVGILRFGRMGSHWGLGILHNDGNCLDCDHGETVDRVMFVSEPLPGYYVTPMFDMNVSGITSAQTGTAGDPAHQLTNSLDSKSYVLAVARRDTDQQAKAKIENNLAVFNYGLHFTYRVQRADAVDFYNNPFPSVSACMPGTVCAAQDFATQQNLSSKITLRNATLYMPDLWAKYERKLFRIEAEVAAVLGNIGNPALTGLAQDQSTTGLSVIQFGAVVQGEYRLLDGQLKIGLELGYASGDNSPGLGNYPNRPTPNGMVAGTIDGPQWNCNAIGCPDTTINNFRFARDYRIDYILWRELLGGITDSLYVKPTINYQIADGFHIMGAVIASRAVFAASTPSGTDPYLGLEFNAGAKYETEDGFFAQLNWAVFFPLAGLNNNNVVNATPLETAQALRALVGIKF